MNGMKSVFVCLVIAGLGITAAPAPAQAPNTNGPHKPEKAAAEKTVPSDGSTQPLKTESGSADFCQCVGQGDSAAVDRIERALRGPLHSTGLDYSDQPLQDVVNQLADEYGIPIQINKIALEEAGINNDAPVNISVHNISLNSALRLVLTRLNNLTYVVQNEVLMITTKEDAEKDLRICVYDARKIMADTSEKNMKSLIETITACVACDTWSVNRGGQAEIRGLSPGLLVISQTGAVHQEIHDLLATIQKMTQNRQPESHAAAAGTK